MRFLYSAIILLLLLPNIVNGQKKKDHYIFHFGLRSADVRSSDALSTNFKPVVDVGFGINYPLNNHIQFQPEIRYTPRGYVMRNNFTDSTFLTNSLSLHYIDFCPNFNYNFGNSERSVTHLSVWAGPYLGVGVVGKYITSGTILNKAQTKADSSFSHTKATFGNGLNRIDYGLNLGIGFQFDKMAQVGVSYSMGFNNLTNIQYAPLYNQSWGLYVRVLFDEMF